MSNNYYNILGVSPGATFEEVKRAYRNLAQEWHPDKWAAKPEAERKAAEEKFKEIAEAYRELEKELKNGPTHNNNAFPKSDPSDPRFWTEPISTEERLRTSEEAIQLIEAKFASSGVTADDLDKWDFPVLFFYSDWKTMMRNCFDRGEFNVKYNKMLEVIEKAVARKKNKNFKTDKKQEKETKKGFATKEEADEYARWKQTEDKASGEDKRKNPQFSDDDSKKKDNYPAPSNSENNYSPNNSQENKPTNNLSSNSDFKQSVKAETDNNINDKNAQQTQRDNNQDTNYLNPNLLEETQPSLLKEYQEEQKKSLENLKKQLVELQNQQSNFRSEVKQQQQPNSNFPWAIVISMGAVILIFGGIILFLLGKRKSR